MSSRLSQFANDASATHRASRAPIPRGLGIAFCALAMAAAAYATVQAQGKNASAAPVHQVTGGGVSFLETGADGGNLIEQTSISARVSADGTASGSISSTLNCVTPGAGQPYPTCTGDPVHFEVTELLVTGNYAYIGVVVTFSQDFPEEVGNWHYYEVIDNDLATGDDLIFFDGFGPLILATGNLIVR